MLGPLLFLMIFIPFVEIYVLLSLGKTIGAMNTFGIIVFTGVLGAWFLKQQGAAVMRDMQSQVGQQQLPADALIKALFTFIGGVLLLTPGFLTDALGFSLVVPPTQALWRAFFGRRIQDGIASGNFRVYTGGAGPRYRADQARDPRVSRPRTPLDDDSVIDISANSKTDKKL